VAESPAAIAAARVCGRGRNAMSAREALENKRTRVGADILGGPRMRADRRWWACDIAIWECSGIASAGSWDPAALLLAGPLSVETYWSNGSQGGKGRQVVDHRLSRQNSRRRTNWPRAFAEYSLIRAFGGREF